MNSTSQIYDLPVGTNAGLDFNYAVWTPGTQVYFSNVPWQSDYRDLAYFSSQSAIDAYLQTHESPTFTFTNLTYAKPGNPIRVNLPFNVCYRFNYLRAVNPAQPVPPSSGAGTDVPRTFYYFITDVKYLAPNTTQIMVQLDVWQTFCRNVTIGNCFVERGHIGIANTLAFDDNGRSYLTVPEGFDLGNEYVIDSVFEHEIASSMAGVTTIGYAVLVASTVAMQPPYGDVTAPVFTTANGSNFEFLPNGCETYYFQHPKDFYHFMTFMADKPWVTQGIISITAIPPFATAEMLNDPFVFDPSNPTDGTAYVLNGWKPEDQSIILAPNFRNNYDLGRYAILKKFLTYPYTLIELTTYSGNPIILKPECIPNANLTVLQMMHLAPPAPRIAFMCKGYNMPKGYDTTNAYAGEFLDMQTGIFDLPTFSIVNNGYISYMASNKNAIAFQHSSADWSQQRAMSQMSAQRVTANIGANLTEQQGQIDVNAINASAQQRAGTQSAQAMQGIVNGGLAAATGGLAGGGRGVIGGLAQAGNAAVTGAVNINQTLNEAGIATGQTSARARASAQGQRDVRDQNYAFADLAQQGDYANAIAGINAKVQDAKMIQPTTSGQIAGDAFNLAVYKWGVWARLKVIQPAVMAMIGEFWLRYGYSINRFIRMPANYQVMDTFTYWKLKETYITSSTCPEVYRQTIRGIFEKGVTVWDDPNDIGNIDIADNAPLPGITYTGVHDGP